MTSPTSANGPAVVIEATDRGERWSALNAALDAVERIKDPAVRSQIAAIVRGLLEFHRDALAELLAQVASRLTKPQSDDWLAEFANNNLVSSLLLLHGLHPEDTHTRLNRALQHVGEELQEHGAAVQLISMDDGNRVRLRLTIKAIACTSTRAAIESAIKNGVFEYTPEIADIDFEPSDDERLSSAAYAGIQITLNGNQLQEN